MLWRKCNAVCITPAPREPLCNCSAVDECSALFTLFRLPLNIIQVDCLSLQCDQENSQSYTIFLHAEVFVAWPESNKHQKCMLDIATFDQCMPLPESASKLTIARYQVLWSEQGRFRSQSDFRQGQCTCGTDLIRPHISELCKEQSFPWLWICYPLKLRISH